MVKNRTLRLRPSTIKKRLTMQEFYEVMKENHSVELALRDDARFRRWYIKKFPKSPLARKYKKYRKKKKRRKRK